MVILGLTKNWFTDKYKNMFSKKQHFLCLLFPFDLGLIPYLLIYIADY